MPITRSPRGLILPLVLLLGACATPIERSDVTAEEPATHDQSLPEAQDDVLARDAGPVEASPKEVDVEASGTAGPRLATDGDDTVADGLLGRVAAQFALPDHQHPRALSERTWLVDRPDYLVRVVERARPYLHLIVEEIERRGMPGEIALLPVVESAFQPFAYSHGRAAGLWQFIPSTGRIYGLKQNWWYDGRRDVKAATLAALDYLEKLAADFDGDWLLALASYNAGEGRVMRAVEKNRRAGKPTDYWSLDLPRETRGYVPKLLAVSDVFTRPGAFGIDLPTIPDAPALAEVETGGQIDLARAADLAGMSVEDLYRLNPGFNRWATDPDGPHTLLLPLEHESTFRTQLAALDPDGRLQWRRHAIRSGETLGGIARHYRTTPAVLRQVNQLDGNLIRAGHHLLIPVASRPGSDYKLSADQRLAKRQADAPEPGARKVTHRVRSGESLWSIGRRYGVSDRSLARWNGMAPRDTLSVGRKLVVWLPGKSGTTRTVTAAATPVSAQLQKIRYTVRAGDSLYLISTRFNVSVSDLRRWNDLGDSNLLHPGQQLTLHVDVTRQATASG